MSDTPPIRLNPDDIVRCSMPRPSEALYIAMAMAGYEANQTSGQIVEVDRKGRARELNTAWDDLPSDFRETLVCEARAMYAVVARAAMVAPQIKASKLKGGTGA